MGTKGRRAPRPLPGTMKWGLDKSKHQPVLLLRKRGRGSQRRKKKSIWMLHLQKHPRAREQMILLLSASQDLADSWLFHSDTTISSQERRRTIKAHGCIETPCLR